VPEDSEGLSSISIVVGFNRFSIGDDEQVVEEVRRWYNPSSRSKQLNTTYIKRSQSSKEELNENLIDTEEKRKRKIIKHIAYRDSFPSLLPIYFSL
jgi:hypothetical protein